MSANDMTCRELADLITEYLELMLPEADRQRLERHLHECIDCQAHLHQVQQTIQLIRQTPQPAVADSERQRLLQLFRSWQSER
jgi:anti-sigma factor RsiW